VPLLFTDNVQ